VGGRASYAHVTKKKKKKAKKRLTPLIPWDWRVIRTEKGKGKGERGRGKTKEKFGTQPDGTRYALN